MGGNDTRGPGQADLDELRGQTPTLDADFRQPCPGCGRELVVRAEQPIRRVRCGTCRRRFTLDRRIGGELCLLPHDSRRYAGHRAWLTTLAALKLRVVTLVLGLVIVGSVLAAMLVAPPLGFLALAVALAFALGRGRSETGTDEGSSRRPVQKRRKRRRRRRADADRQ